MHSLNKEFRAQFTLFRIQVEHLAQLKMLKPTLLEQAHHVDSKWGMLSFCHNVIATHRIGTFGGKPTLWDFIRDIAKNLNRPA